MVEEIVKIVLFDDGRESYSRFPNEWIVVEKKFGGGKLVLKNKYNRNIIIRTISAWKTVRFKDNLSQDMPS